VHQALRLGSKESRADQFAEKFVWRSHVRNFEIHDHFDGEAHCIECRGKCVLSGDSLELTRLVRKLCEFLSYGAGWIPPQIEDHLRSMVKDYAGFKEHCLRVNPKRVCF
jgi:hypothetical protein